MSNKNKNWFWPGVIIFLLALGAAWWAINRQFKPEAEPKFETKTANEPETLNSVNQATSALEKENSQPDNNHSGEEVDSANNVRDDTKLTFSQSEEKKIASLIKEFEQAFHTTDYSSAFSQFSNQVRSNQKEGEIRTKSPAPPASFEITSISLRSDSTALAQVIESRADNSIQRRFFELVPIDQDYQIVSYFSPSNPDTYIGFYLD